MCFQVGTLLRRGDITSDKDSIGEDVLCVGISCSKAYLLGGGFGDIRAIPEAVDANLLEFGAGCVGVEPLPGVQHHLAGRQLHQRVLWLRCRLLLCFPCRCRLLQLSLSKSATPFFPWHIGKSTARMHATHACQSKAICLEKFPSSTLPGLSLGWG